MRREALGGALALAVCIAATAAGGSLPEVTIGPRPGPAVLYQPLATAPQLEDGGGWPAAPLMVSGTDAYAVTGAGEGKIVEYVYQDYVYDSFGANTTDQPFAQPETVPNSGDTAFGAMTGDVVYPTNAAIYGHDAADLLEFRAKLVEDGVAYRITLNTMLTPDVAAVAIGVDTDKNATTGKNDWGYGIGSLGPLGLEHVLVAWGTGAELDGGSIAAGVNVTRNQIEVTAPLAPDGATWRHYAVVGLFDAQTKSFKRILEQPTATEPGGAHGQNPPPIFNLGFRFEGEHDEPRGDEPTVFGSRGSGYGHWSEHGQATALAARDDQWGPAKPFLDGVVDRDPSRVTFRAMPEKDNAALGLVHDHAYWVSDIVVAPGARSGLVDARSLARGEGDPEVVPLAGAGIDPAPHAKRGLTWEAADVTPAEALDVKLTDVSSVTLWVERAGVSNVDNLVLTAGSNVPARVTLAGSFGMRVIQVPPAP